MLVRLCKWYLWWHYQRQSLRWVLYTPLRWAMARGWLELRPMTEFEEMYASWRDLRWVSHG